MQIILVLENRKSDDHKSMRKVFHLITKLFVNHSDIGKAYGSTLESVITKIKNSVKKIEWLKQLWNMILSFFSVIIDRNNSIEKWR